MSVTRKITGLTMVVAGFTFFAWFVALNTISPSIPEGLQGTAKLFMILSGVTGVGFLVSGGMAFFGHDEHVERQKNFLGEDSVKNPPYEPPPETASEVLSPVSQPANAPDEDVTIEVGEEKKKEEKKEGWDSPSKTGWG